MHGDKGRGFQRAGISGYRERTPRKCMEIKVGDSRGLASLGTVKGLKILFSLTIGRRRASDEMEEEKISSRQGVCPTGR
jgi:hypothetical protein